MGVLFSLNATYQPVATGSNVREGHLPLSLGQEQAFFEMPHRGRSDSIKKLLACGIG
jgi:hypothetical protein